VEVDARGRVVNPRASVAARPPVPGNPIQLTLDIKLQEYVRQIFPDTMEGSVVAMVPSTGEILAIYSHPSYDPNDFVGRIPAGCGGRSTPIRASRSTTGPSPGSTRRPPPSRRSPRRSGSSAAS
jgi:cell division protein FtsI/penicillin-binding protein 2